MREAEFILGREALCAALAVSAQQVAKWISGEESVPDAVFWRAVDIVVNARG